MSDLVKSFIRYLEKEKKLSDNTLASYKNDIKLFSAFLEQKSILLENVTGDVIQEFLKTLKKKGRASATISRCLASLKNFFAY